MGVSTHTTIQIEGILKVTSLLHLLICKSSIVGKKAQGLKEATRVPVNSSGKTSCQQDQRAVKNPMSWETSRKAASSIVSTGPDPDDSTETPLEGECLD